MNKAELIAAVAENAELTKKDAEKAVKAFIEVVTDELKKGEKVQVVGFGTFEVAEGEVYRLKEQDFVLAARVMGESAFTIIVREIIPNIMGLLITNLTMAIPSAIFQEAFLSYIGLGISPPQASWGVLAKEGTRMMTAAPHMLYVPAFFICTTVLALNQLGNGLRDAFDPRLRGTE